MTPPDVRGSFGDHALSSEATGFFVTRQSATSSVLMACLDDKTGSAWQRQGSWQTFWTGRDAGTYRGCTHGGDDQCQTFQMLRTLAKIELRHSKSIRMFKELVEEILNLGIDGKLESHWWTSTFGKVESRTLLIEKLGCVFVESLLWKKSTYWDFSFGAVGQGIWRGIQLVDGPCI